MKILITGGLGFQGSHLTEYLLKQGHRIIILNTFSEIAERNLNLMRKKPIVVWGSITDLELVNKTVRGCDAVFHLAAHINVDESIEFPERAINTNINGTVNILNAVRENHNRLILVSSCEVYGAPVNSRFIDEETELRPHSPYAASKVAADRLCFSYFKTYGLHAVILRPFNVFGPRQKEDKFGSLIPMFVKQASLGKNLEIHGDGKQTRDYTYIDDLIRAYGLVLKSKNTDGEVYNFGTEQETSIKDIALYIANKFKVGIDYIEARPGQVTNFCADISKARETFGWKPKFNLWQGIDRYILWRTKL